MALGGNYLTVRLQQHSSGTVNEVVAETTSVDATFTAEALDATEQSDALTANYIGGKCTMQVSGDYLLASDGDQFTRLFAHADAGEKISVTIYRSSTKVFDTEGVFTSLSKAGGLSDSLVTGAYSMELDVTSLSTTYGSTYTTVYNAMTNKPTTDIAAAQNTMVESLVDGGVWAKLDVFYLFAQYSNDDSEALINWVNPGTNDASAVSSPSWTSLEGYTGDGVADYINTNFVPSTEGVNYATNDASAFMYIRNNVAEDMFDMSVIGSGDNKLICRARGSADQIFYGLNQTSGNTQTNADSRGLFYYERTASNSTEGFRNNVSLGTDATASSGRPNLAVYVLAQNNNGSPGSYSTHQISIAGLGGSLTSGQRLTLMNAIETYMDSNSKGVIT